MARTACLVVKVTSVSGRCKKNTWKASASSGHKTKQAGQQGRQANKAGRPTRQLGLPALFCARFHCFVPATSACSSKWIFQYLMHLEQSTFLRYLWLGYFWKLSMILWKDEVAKGNGNILVNFLHFHLNKQFKTWYVLAFFWFGWLFWLLFKIFGHFFSILWLPWKKIRKRWKLINYGLTFLSLFSSKAQ